jgi:type I restriction enzyme S subunit
VFGSNGIVGRHSKFLVQGPGIVVGRKGSVGEVCWSVESFWPIDTAYYVVPKGQTDLRWLFWLLSGTDLKSLDAATGVPGLNRNDVYTLTAHKPRPEEQSRIAIVLDTVDEAIAKAEAVIAKLKQMRAGLLHDLLCRGLDENGQLRDPIAHPEQFQNSPLGRIPREWTVRSADGMVSQPSDLTIGPFGSNLLASDYKSEGAPVIFVRDVREDGFVWNSNIYVSKDKADELRAHSVFAGDVLITKMGLPPCIAAVYPNEMPHGVVTADVIRLRPQIDVATSFWLAAYINSPRFAACVRQITGGVTRPKVTLADFRKQPIPLPSIEEQDRIENIVMATAHEIDEVEAESQKLLMLKSGLMTDLLIGRVRVPEHLGVRRHDAASSSHEDSGDASPHSKEDTP